MFKKRLKGLLAMVLAGSIAATALPMSASATLGGTITDGTITIVDGPNPIATIDPSQITSSGFSSGYLSENPDYLNDNNMWAVGSCYIVPGAGSGNINATVSGNNLAGKLNEYKESDTTYYDTSIKYSHQYVVTTDDPKTTDISAASSANATTFPVTIDSPDPQKSITGYTVWYGVVDYSDTLSAGSAVKAGDTTTLLEPADSISIPMSTFEGLYTADILEDGDGWENFVAGVTLIQVDTEYKTFEIPVYDGLGKLTTDKVSVTDGDTGDLIPDGKTEALNGSYVLVYDKDSSTQKVSAAFTNKADLWNAIEAVANEHSEFDVSKAKLVRYVNYDASYEDYYNPIIFNTIRFTSVDLLNEVDINYLNERKNSGSIWNISCSEISPTGLYIYPNKFVSGDSFDDGIKEFLNEYACDMVYLSNKNILHITATDPSTQADQDGNIDLSGKYITVNTDKQYPVKVSDLAAKLTAEISPTAGMTYNKDEWELWACDTSTGGISMGSKATVADPTADIGITHYELAREQKRNDLLVYFPQVAIAPSLEFTAPVAGETPSFEYTIKDTVGGYEVLNVEWSCGNTLLRENDKFEAGKEYTVKIELWPDEGLSFTNSTPVTITGEEADISYAPDAAFYAYRNFTTAPEKPSPEKPSNVKATAGDSNITLTWNAVKGAAKYKVMYRLSGTTEWKEQETNDTSYNVTGLTNGKAYEFIVLAGNASGWSKWTDKDIVTATPNEYKGAVLKYGDVYEEVGTVAAAFTRITKLNKPENEYIITVNTDLTEKALSFPKAAKSISLITTDDAVITFSGTSISTATDVIFNCDITPQSAGKTIAVKAAAGKALTFEKSLANLVTVSGTATSVLNVGCDMTAASVSSFKEVNIKDDCTLTVTGNVSGVAKLGGTLKLLNPKATAAITDVENAVFELTSGADTKGNFIMPKVTVKNVLEKLEITVVDEKGDEVKLKNKATVLYLSTAADTTGEITVTNINTADEKLTAFRYNKEIKACYADQLSLYINNEKDRNYPDLELVFAKIKANEAELGKDKESADYEIELNADTDGTKLVLPAKAKSITINGNGHKLSLTGVTALSPKYDFTLENVNIVNEKKLTINAGGSLTLKDVASTMPLDIKGGAGSTITLENVIGTGTLSGTNTTILNVESDLSTGAVSTFGELNIASEKKLTVNGNISGVVKARGKLSETSPKATIKITKADGLALEAVRTVDTNGKPVFAKATITEVTENGLTMGIVDENGNLIALPSGTAVVTCNKADNITIANSDLTEKALTAHLHGKEIRACFAELVTLYDGEEKVGDYCDFETAVKNINDKGKVKTKNYRLVLNNDADVDTLTLPNTAKSIELDGNGNSIRFIKLTSLAAKTDFTLKNITIDAVKPITISASQNLNIENVESEKITAIKGSAKFALTVNGCDMVDSVSGFKTVNLNSSFGARNSFAVAANLAIGENGELMVPAGAKVQLKDVSGAEGAKLNLAAGISPIKITGTATGKIAITGTVTDGTQLFTTKTADLGIFDTSEITPDDGLEYDLNNISGKVYFRGKKLKIGEKTFALWNDMVTYIRNQKNADADYVIEILGDYNVGGAFKLPAKGTYKSIEIKSDNEEIKRSISFTGTSVAATGKLILKDIELVSLNTKGAKVKYTVNAGANELVLENCNPEMAAISATGTVTLKNTAIGGTVKAGTLNLNGDITFNDTVTAGAINCLGDTNVDILMKKYLNVSTKKGIVTNDNTLTIRIVGADKDAVKPLPLDKTGAYVLSSAFKGTVTDGIKISDENGSYKLEIKNGKLLVKAAE
ncbi:MAG: fibronectin type III domain-containing protein [Oscillospiraceae bacterium]|nr:fibronectin type III domain-containing protein [Oscillospiraceae bacterium]